MIHIRTKYIVYTHGNTGVRHHNFNAQNNIIDASDDLTQPGPNVFHTANGWPTLQFNGKDVSFAFMSIHGALDGNHLYTSAANQQVPVGETDMDVLVVYGPPGGVGVDGGPGIWIDAFNVDTGNFSDSLDFITVLTPPTPPETVDSPKSVFANQEGEISTLMPENMRANNYVDGVPFLQWKKISPPQSTVTTKEIDLAQNESGEIWFAFYQTVPSSIHIIDMSDKIGVLMGHWISDDYCGTPPGRVGPHGPYPFHLTIDEMTMKTLSSAQRSELSRAMEEYPAIANAAYSALEKANGALAGVGQILAGGKNKVG